MPLGRLASMLGDDFKEMKGRDGGESGLEQASGERMPAPNRIMGIFAQFGLEWRFQVRLPSSEVFPSIFKLLNFHSPPFPAVAATITSPLFPRMFRPVTTYHQNKTDIVGFQQQIHSN